MESAKVESDQLRDYELVTIISPEVADDDVPAALEKMSQLIVGKGGTVTEVNQWGRRKLAYPIQHFMEGNYVLTQFKIEPKMTAELEASLRLAEEILRHLLVKLGD